MDHPMAGLAEGPIGADTYKRAVYRPPPSKFTVEMLTPTKQGGNYSYGMRICPIIQGNRYSISSESSYSEYEVWRRWEDCLAFQGTLELEYSRMARAKRQRLLRGKGVKRDGFYKQDQASSWESLPPGPAPDSVARDIHDYIPPLTKKGTLFRASQATIAQRAAELKALVDGLLRDDVPALIDELRNNRVISDFFGYWRRDYELAEKQQKQRLASKSRTSVTSSIFSTYFSTSNSSIPDLHSYSESISSTQVTYTQRRIRDILPNIPEMQRNRKTSSGSSDNSVPSNRSRAYSTGSSTFSPSTTSEESLGSPYHVAASILNIPDDTPISFNHNPYYSDAYIGQRLSPDLAENYEMHPKAEARNELTVGKERKSSAGSVRNGMIFLSPPPPPHVLASSVSADFEEHTSVSFDRINRESWQTMDSASCILEGIDIDLPTSPFDYSHRASMRSVMTNCSAEGVLPRSSIHRRRSRIVSGPVSISEFDNDWSDPEEDILDAFLSESFPLPTFDIPFITPGQAPENRPQTPLGRKFSDDGPSLPHVPPSPAESTTFSISTNASTSERLSLKVGYNGTFIALRVAYDISYKDLRQRIYNKFISLEGIPLSESFTISFLQSTPLETVSHSENGMRFLPSNTEKAVPYSVTSEVDWENVMAINDGHKLTLRISDNIPS